MLHSPAPSNANIAADQILAIPMIRGVRLVRGGVWSTSRFLQSNSVALVRRSRNAIAVWFTASSPFRDGSESNGPGDCPARRIMASGTRDMKKSMSTARVKEGYSIKIEELPIVRTKKAWTIMLSQDVVLASGRSDDDVVVDWLRMSTDTT